LKTSESIQPFKLIHELDKSKILELLRKVENILDLEKNLAYIPKGKTMVIGDLHGDIKTLEKIIQLFYSENFQTLLFLGDYIDRGVNQLEVINTLFYYKQLSPKKIILLRGNHEDHIINRYYGFYDQIKLKFSDYKYLFRRYNQVFSKLPLAAITWNKIFCVHGGVPEGLDDIEEINFLPNDQKKINDPITTQLVWNDPREKNSHFKNSNRGPGIKTFGKKAFDKFMDNNDLNLMIRAHERFKNGFKKYFDEKLISIFSSQSYSKRSCATVAYIRENGNVELIPV